MGSFMEYYIPKFRRFLRDILSKKDLFATGYDYVVPIESKGAMLLNQLLGENAFELENAILYSRAFDYISPSDLRDKNLLLLDDIVFSGRTLENCKNHLEKKGVTKIIKAAFLKYPKLEDKEKESEDIFKDIMTGFSIDTNEYHAFASEITEFYIKERPSYPDHFKISIMVDMPIVPEMLDDLGTLVRYDRSNIHNEWSIHYPNLNLNNVNHVYKKYDSTFKIRLRNNAINPLKWKISPVVFPSLAREPQADELDSLEKSLFKILHREWHDEVVQRFDVYESITLADRIKSLCGLIRFLELDKVLVKEITFDISNLRRYYGPEATKKIKQVAVDYLKDRENFRFSFSEPKNDFDMFRVPKLRIPIISLLDEKYRNHPDNIGKSPRLRKSVGLTVSEIAAELDEGLVTTSVACESVNDYGYIVPMIEELSRKYRDSEIGKELLDYERY